MATTRIFDSIVVMEESGSWILETMDVDGWCWNNAVVVMGKCGDMIRNWGHGNSKSPRSLTGGNDIVSTRVVIV
jgi:hypothetical protein